MSTDCTGIGRSLSSAAPVLLALLLFAEHAKSEPAPDVNTNCASDAMLVLDASGSMSASDFPEGAPNRIDRVRQALARVIPKVAPLRRLGLIVYGPGLDENSCRNIEIKLKPSPGAGRAILDIADRVRPSGRTPLTRSVELALEALASSPRPAEIIVLTDGEDTCGGDPCQLARRITAEAPGVTVHVIGYRLPANSETSGARCLADQTNGLFATAETTDELTDALRRTLSCADVSGGSEQGPRTFAIQQAKGPPVMTKMRRHR